MKLLFKLLLVFSICNNIKAQVLTKSQVKDLIATYKNDIRGPYYRIKWFCEDGTVRDAKDPCPGDLSGIQHASFKESALKLRASNDLYLGEILAANDIYEFLDKSDNYNRLKQYQLNKYLMSVDDGWVLRKGQFYRGAIQSEDEEEWGKEFFERILRDNDFINEHYYLLRQALKDIPHNGNNNLAQLMRSQSKMLSEDYPKFMDLRIKIHGQPEASDIPKVRQFYSDNKSKLSTKQQEDFKTLINTMEANYAPLDFSELEKEVNRLPQSKDLTKALLDFIENNKKVSNAIIVENTADILSQIRNEITSFSSSKQRLLLLDISNKLEHQLLTKVQEWETKTVNQQMHKIVALICAAEGTGLIEQWEYDSIENTLNSLYTSQDFTVKDLSDFLSVSRSVVEWSAAMAKATYIEVVEHYSGFEPLAYGYIDDRVRSSVALSLGNAVSDLGKFYAEVTNLNNRVLNLDNTSSFRGLNPGYALGELVVIDANPDAVEVDETKIYIFERPPSDLKPVAGIMTVSEGNLVSHVQLLARNLGIPNAALSQENLNALKPHNGKKIFYAVSNEGNLVVKLEKKMSSAEKALFAKKKRNKTVVTVPTNQIQLDRKTVLNMRELSADDSGKFCGPKAANLGELKQMFPENVVEGLVIPFGIFREHMSQNMPGESKSYWSYLNETFATAKSMENLGKSTEEIEAFQLKALDKLHKSIVDIKLKSEFVSNLKSQFLSIFGNRMGKVPVFLRSDTNMEDLKEFTGAGLNLTLFNILDESEILKGIKQVWASAYTERSFKWRQKYLSNPENVFPSILIIPSVDVDFSGVMITKGINTGSRDDLTVAFSRGAGGAVDGQSAETRLITETLNILLTPARQQDYIRLPKTGKTKKYFTGFHQPILNDKNIADIRLLAKAVRKQMSEDSSNNQVYDVEFGFKDDKLWLFQIRPFVENKSAKSSDYLASITPKIKTAQTINRQTKL